MHDDPGPASASLSVIVLAAGEGTRMKSATPKVLHTIGGRSLLDHVLAAAEPLRPQHRVVVVGHGRDQVLATLAESVTPVVQERQGGTGHATRLAVEAVVHALEQRGRTPGGTVLVLFGDTPLLTAATLDRLLAEHERTGAAATLLTAPAEDPTGYGRVIRDERGAVRRIVEQRDATETERAVREINTGVAAYDLALLRDALKRLTADNVAGEEYLPDVIATLVADGRPVDAIPGELRETAGVNDRVQLAAAGAALRDRTVRQAMTDGVTVVDPATTWIDVGVTVGRDTVIESGVQLLGRTAVGCGARIGPDTTITDSAVGDGAVVCRAHCVDARIGPAAAVGPFAYLRGGATLARGAKAGTYVELKAAEIGPGSKVPHLSYVGDATIGAGSNIGAGTIFANYDGVSKTRSVVGDGARTGANNTFVAPVQIGDGAYTGAGTVIRSDVPPGSLAVTGGVTQRVIEGWTVGHRAGTVSAEAAHRATARPDAAAAPGQPPAANQPEQGPPEEESGAGEAGR
ncbi:MAG: bifunctional UDP-N-acetylglucosamine diphosphorylase/glucosamine-1-phosphate N-acetyltransferase GlmU [Mycobacteriales bacterium]